MRIVTFDARWDAFSRAAREYRRGVLYPSLAAAGAQLEPVAGDLLDRTALTALGDKPCSLLTGSGHGRAAALFGDEFALVLNADPLDRRIPAAALQGAVVHLLACHTACLLGPALVAAGTAAFLGYDDEFRFDPACPEVAFACDAEIDRALVAGLSAGGAAARARAAFTRAAADARSRGDKELAAMLEFDRDHLRGPDDDSALGDAGSVLRS